MARRLSTESYCCAIDLPSVFSYQTPNCNGCSGTAAEVRLYSVSPFPVVSTMCSKPFWCFRTLVSAKIVVVHTWTRRPNNNSDMR